MTLRTALIVNGDSDQAKQALAELEQQIGRTEKQVEELGQEGVKASVGLERLRQAQEEAARAGITLSQAQQRAAMHGREWRQELDGLGRALEVQRTRGGENVVSMGAQRAGMQQLSFQLADVARMYSMGARPMQIFASQGTQVVQAIGMMRGSAGGLVGFLGGPWGVGMIAAATLMTPLISKIFETEDALDGLGDAAEEAMKRVRDSLVNVSAMSDAASKNIHKRITAMGALARAERDQAEAQNLVDTYSGTPGATEAVQIYARQRAEASRQAAAARAEIAEADAALEELRSYSVPQGIVDRIRNGDGTADRDRPTSNNTSTRNNRPAGRAGGISDEERERQQATKATDDYIAGLEREIATIGMGEQALRQFELQRARDAAQTDDQRKRIDELNSERERALAIEEQRQRAGAIAEENEATAGSIAQYEREAQVIGIVGWERQRAILLMEREAELRPVLAQLAEAEAAGHEDVAAALREQIDLLHMKYGLQVQLGAETERLEAERDAVREVGQSYDHLNRQAAGALSDIILYGDSASEVMKRLALSILDASLQAALLGDGPLAAIMGGGGESGGLLGSLLTSIGVGGARATGGPVSPGKIYAVNERSTAPGLFLPIAPGRIDAPGNDNGSGQAGRQIPPLELRVSLSDDLRAEMRATADRSTAAGIAGYRQVVFQDVLDQQARKG